jgi:hydroxymethylpyrimidine pyrophosphatase-like HAD family hydrolase
MSPVLHLGEDVELALPSRARQPLLIVDLLNDLDALAGHLRSELEGRSWLNAYLLAAGMNQVTEDHLQADDYLLRKAAEYLAMAPGPVGWLGQRAVRGLDSWRLALRSSLPRQRRVAEWQTDLASLVNQLADIVAGGEPLPAAEKTVQILATSVLENCAALPPALRRALIRLPSCFRSFDQKPEDMRRLVAKLIAQGHPRRTPIASVGLRTSGSYLGPLAAAYLRREGYGNVVALTLRPGDPMPARDRRTIRQIARLRGLVLLTDDPPTTGGSFDKAARELANSGVPAESVVLLVPLLGPANTLPAKIARHRHVLLPWAEWAIHDQMTHQAVAKGLGTLIGPRYAVDHVKRVSAPAAHGGRGHVEARFRVLLRDRVKAVQSEADVHVAGVGLGYLGEHSLAVAQRLSRLVPKVYGVHGGLMFRSWIATGRRLQAKSGQSDAEILLPFLIYVRARAEALKVAQDTSLRMRGRLPVWEVASNILSRAFGRAWVWARVPLVDPVVKRILVADDPTVVDGSMDPRNWYFTNGRTQRLVKIDFDRRAFSNLDLTSYDSVFDIASLAADLEIESWDADRPAVRPQRVSEAYAKMTGQSISSERWLLLQLVHMWDRLRSEPGREVALSRALARATQRYFVDTFLKGITSFTTGRFCALDVDGVLETESLGFPSLTHSSAVSLRALLLHGYRPLPVTGRSVAEVRERCSAFGLAGGVAEYGSAVYHHESGTVTSLVSGDLLRDLRRLRDVFRKVEGIQVNDDHQHSIRLYRLGRDGTRLAPSLALITRVVAEQEMLGSVTLHAGDSQVDLVAAGIDKAVGLTALLSQLGVDVAADGPRPLALAVGDGPADIPMFRLAELAAAPAHASAAVRHAAGRGMPRPYQAGLADAVGALLGHRPGSCSVCSMPALPPDARAMMTLLSAQERGPSTMALAAISLAFDGRSRRPQPTPFQPVIVGRHEESGQ